ncbi:MAG: 6-bladed beta-propeller, partial [Tannerellaceae bacterium]|nr:6-bladed beta-propeller [Tannerellaceae bacterium]
DRATGKGLRKINRKGQGGEEYTYALGVVLDEDRGEMFVNDHSARKILVYDLEGNFKRSFRHKEGATYANVCNFDRGNLICYDGHVSNDGEANEQLFMIASKEDGSITKDILIPFEKKILTDIIVKDGNGMTWGASPSNHYPVIPCFDGFILTEASSDTIYTYSLDCVMTPFIVRTPPARSMDPVVFLFPSIITGRYYFMSALKREYDFDKNEGFPDVDLMYDREEKAIYKPTVYNDDYTGGQEIDMKTRPVSGEIVTRQLLQSDRLVEDFKAGKLKGRLAEIAAGLDEESNPVIMLVKHKK